MKVTAEFVVTEAVIDDGPNKYRITLANPFGHVLQTHSAASKAWCVWGLRKLGYTVDGLDPALEEELRTLGQ